MAMRLRARFLALGLVIAVGACGSASPDTTLTPADTEGGSTPESSASSTPATSVVESEGATVIPVGAVYPLTGEFADYAVIWQEGINLVLPEVNADLEEIGYQIEMIYEDSEGDPNLGLSAFQKLVNVDSAPVSLVAGGSSVVLATLPVAEENGVVVFQTGANSPRLVGASDLLVNFNNSGILEAEAAVAWAHEVQGLRELAVVSLNNDFGLPLGDTAAAVFEERGGSVVAREQYEEEQTDFSGLVASLRAAEPDVLYLASTGGTVAPFIRAAREGGLTVPILASGAVESPDTLELLGAEDQLYWTNADFGPDKEYATEFIDRYTAEYGNAPFAAEAALQADAIDVLGDAITAIHESGGEVTGQAIRDYIMEDLVYHVGYSGPFYFRPDGNTVRPLAIFTLAGTESELLFGSDELEELGVLASPETQ